MSTQTQKRNPLFYILIVMGLCTSVLCIGVALTALLDREGDEVATTEVAQVVSVSTEIPVEVEPSITSEPTNRPEPSNTPEPTNTPRPTSTPRPTATEVPTDTPDPNLLRPGTYLVGDDIQPGLYKGLAGDSIAGSCYWARLAGLSGGLEDILSNDNAIGPYYIEVLESDFALDTACQVRLMGEMTPAQPFPTEIGPGSYLVGVDIQPGTYRGQAGQDITESCYWARVSGFSGDFGNIMANDNAIGQYFIEVQPGDYGLLTLCDLSLVE